MTIHVSWDENLLDYCLVTNSSGQDTRGHWVVVVHLGERTSLLEYVTIVSFTSMMADCR